MKPFADGPAGLDHEGGDEQQNETAGAHAVIIGTPGRSFNPWSLARPYAGWRGEQVLLHSRKQRTTSSRPAALSARWNGNAARISLQLGASRALRSDPDHFQVLGLDSGAVGSG